MKKLVLLTVVSMTLSAGAGAQDAAPAKATAQDGIKAAESLEHWRETLTPMFMNDYGDLHRYHDADTALGPPASNEQRVIFFGDSITDGWKLDESFPGDHYINRGISGQTTPQMLLRFRQDVVDLRPDVVVILAGTNDIAGNTGPESLEQIEGNFASMAEISRAHGIRVVLSSVTPISDAKPQYFSMALTRSAEKILALNDWLKQYCAANSLVYLDYFPAMANEQGQMKESLTGDGLHPNAAGFAVMAPLAKAAIAKALSQPVVVQR
jgi:lysophospholipase L1-like esterase